MGCDPAAGEDDWIYAAHKLSVSMAAMGRRLLLGSALKDRKKAVSLQILIWCRTRCRRPRGSGAYPQNVNESRRDVQKMV
jgi:hypothetical protein